jgi:membrane protein DedA with SNARE-associated domain
MATDYGEAALGFADQIMAAVLTMAGSPWVYVAMFLLAFGDQFFPPIPSDPVLLALVVSSHQLGLPRLWLLIPAAIVGAILGNLGCYWVGRKVGTDRFKTFRTGKGKASIEKARVQIEKRGMGYIIAARWIPVARIGIIMVVGAMHYPLSKFLIASTVSLVFWGLNATAIGSIFGAIEALHPMLAILIGIITGLIVGMVLDRLVGWFLNRHEPPTEA